MIFMSVEISLGSLPFVYLVVIFLTPIQFNMDIFLVICGFTLGITLITLLLSRR